MRMLLVLIATPVLATPFFWEGKPALEDRIYKKNEILVSVKNEDKRSKLHGVGLIKATPAKVAQVATDTDKIRARVHEIKELSWDQKTGAFKSRIQLLWIDQNIEGRAHYYEADKDQPKRIEYHIDKGLWFTAKGTVYMRAYNEGKSCLTIIDATTIEEKEFSWPVRVAMEATLQRMAGALRHYVEEGAP